MDERRTALHEAASRRHDLIVIGGGINGAGIARDAALRGLSVVLLERDDYGFGTTWRSTKLIHGGLRYLEHREWRLVFEGLRERAILLRTAPHLVRPLRFLTPIFRHGRYSRRTVHAGLILYDLLAMGRALPHHRAYDRDGLLRLEPALNRHAITGGFTYSDAQAPVPERLCLETITAARAAGALAFNHLAAERLLLHRGRVTGVRAVDIEDGTRLEITAPVIVNAAGPWADDVLARAGLRAARPPALGGTKGTHIVVDFAGTGPRHAVYAEAGADCRPFFIVPWLGRHLIGTTDDRFAGDPATVRPSEAEVAYLMHETSRVLPGAPLATVQVWYAFAGVRPLPRAAGRPTGAITRRHFIIDHDRDGAVGLFSIVGGKLTSYRALAREVVDRIEISHGRRPAPCRTETLPLVPGDGVSLPRAVPMESAARLHLLYGPRAATVLALRDEEPALGAPLCPHGPDIAAEVVYAGRHEQARTVGDVLLRRTPAGWNRCRGLDAAPTVAALLARCLGRDQAWQMTAVAAYRDEVERALAPMPGAIEPPVFRPAISDRSEAHS